MYNLHVRLTSAQCRRVISRLHWYCWPVLVRMITERSIRQTAQITSKTLRIWSLILRSVTWSCSTTSLERHFERRSPPSPDIQPELISASVNCISPNSTCCVTSRHDTPSCPCILAQEKSWRAVSRLSDSTARHARHDKRDRRDSLDTCSGASAHSMDWGGHVHLTFSRSCSWDANPEHKKTKFVHASTTAWFFVVRHIGTSTARHARRARHVVRGASWRDATSGIWASECWKTVHVG